MKLNGYDTSDFEVKEATNVCEGCWFFDNEDKMNCSKDGHDFTEEIFSRLCYRKIAVLKSDNSAVDTNVDSEEKVS